MVTPIAGDKEEKVNNCEEIEELEEENCISSEEGLAPFDENSHIEIESSSTERDKRKRIIINNSSKEESDESSIQKKFLLQDNSSHLNFPKKQLTTKDLNLFQEEDEGTPVFSSTRLISRKLKNKTSTSKDGTDLDRIKVNSEKVVKMNIKSSSSSVKQKNNRNFLAQEYLEVPKKTENFSKRSPIGKHRQNDSNDPFLKKKQEFEIQTYKSGVRNVGHPINFQLGISRLQGDKVKSIQKNQLAEKQWKAFELKHAGIKMKERPPSWRVLDDHSNKEGEIAKNKLIASKDPKKYRSEKM